MPDVVVVGGGVAGLVTARDLAAAGLRVTVLEAAERVGGCVAPLELAGLRLDAGAESFATRTSAVADLLAELGLADAVVTPAPGGAWVQLPDGAVPLPRGGLLGIPASARTADVRRVIGLRGVLRASLDHLLPAGVGLGHRTRPGVSGPDAVSLGHVVRVRLGARVLDRLVAPVVTGVHSVHPDLLDLDAVLPTGPGLRERLLTHGSLAAAVASLRPVPGAMPARAGSVAASPDRRPTVVAPGSAVAGLVGGMNRLVTALSDDLTARGVTLRTDAAVTSLDPNPPDAPAEHWTVCCTDGTELTARSVVLAVPAAQALSLLPPGTLSDAGGPRGRSTPDNSVGAPVVLVTLVLDAPVLDSAPRGTGVLVADEVPGVRAKALTHATAKWPWLAQAAGAGRHVLRLSYGPTPQSYGPMPQSSLPSDGIALRDLALTDATRLLGVPLGVEHVVGWARTDWPGGQPQPDPGHRTRTARIERELAGLASPLHLTGAWVAGTGLAAVVEHARATATALIERADAQID